MRFYIDGVEVPESELEQIESIENEDGSLRKRFIIKGLKNSPIFEEPNRIGDKINTLSLKESLEMIMKYAKLLENEMTEKENSGKKLTNDELYRIWKNKQLRNM